MLNFKRHLVNFLGFVQYQSARMRNFYPCKLIGESHSEKTNKTVIIYHKIGNTQPMEMSINAVLNNPALVAQFSPIDSLQLGAIAFEELIFSLPKDARELKFNEIKNIMLNSTHDVSPSKLDEKLSLHIDQPNLSAENPLIRNSYKYKLVGEKTGNTKGETIIIYTILGKREGYEKPLPELITNKSLIEKFHPTEAVKFGFISLGDIQFTRSGAKND